MADVKINIEASVNGAKAAIDGIDKSLEAVGKTAQETAGGFKVAGLSLTDMKSGFDMVLGVAGPIIGKLKETIDAASDLNETVSKSKVVFGDMAGAVEEMGNSAAAAMGMSKNEAIAAAATYGNLFVSMGMASDKSAEMSTNLVKLAGDLASFNNIPVGEALEKLRAGLVGESEPLKSLGININEVALKQEALILGLGDGKTALDASAKAQAAYSLMLKQSATAQGDFARTADGVANQQRILEATQKNLAASIGEGLLPAYKDLLSVGNQLLKWADLMVNWSKKTQVGLEDIAREAGKTSQTVDEYNKVVQDYIKNAGLQVEADGRVYKIIAYGNSYRKEYISDLEKLKSSAFAAVPSFLDLTSSIRSMRQSTVDTVPSLADLALALQNEEGAWTDTSGAMERYTRQAEAAKLASERYTVALSGGAGIRKATEDYKKSVEELNREIMQTRLTLDALVKLPYKSPQQLQDIEELKAKLGEQQQAVKDLETTHMEATQNMIYNMLLQKAASDGLTATEYENMMKIGTAFGIVDEKSAAWALALNSLDLSDANLKLSDVLGLLNGIANAPSLKEIFIKTYYESYYNDEAGRYVESHGNLGNGNPNPDGGVNNTPGGTLPGTPGPGPIIGGKQSDNFMGGSMNDRNLVRALRDAILQARL